MRSPQFLCLLRQQDRPARTDPRPSRRASAVPHHGQRHRAGQHPNAAQRRPLRLHGRAGRFTWRSRRGQARVGQVVPDRPSRCSAGRGTTRRLSGVGCLGFRYRANLHDRWGIYGTVGSAVRPDSCEGMRRMSRYRVAVDVGGTFTDLIVHDEESGSVSIAKTASIPADPAAAIMAALEQAQIAPSDMAFFAHGSTVGTNALITRRLPRTAVVATEGFRDVHEIRRGTKPDLWDAYSDVAPPYVRRRDRYEVPERIDYAGTVLTEFDEDAARTVARRIKERGYESVAITFINAYMNGEHEARMKAIMEEEAPGVFVCTSHEILPEVFEHERFSTTIINACLAPVVSRYLASLTDQLRDGEYKGDVLVLHSGGGVMTAEAISRNAARIAVSGPAAGAMA